MSNELKTIIYLIIHHTATARDTTTFEAVKKYHISLGWGDIGYHYFITADGNIWQGRTEQTVGAHAKADNMNFKSLGICLTGNFMKEEPTLTQLNALLGLLTFLKGKYNIPKNNILGHKEVKGANTLCPGDNLMPHIINYRNSIEEIPQTSGIEEAITHIEKALEILKNL